MTGPDGEFDDFLTRRKPVFRRPEDDPLEPPPELDRIVLRRAREAIEADQSDRAYHGRAGACRWRSPRRCSWCSAWSCISASRAREPVGEVSVQTVAQQVDSPRCRIPPRPPRSPTLAPGPVRRERDWRIAVVA